MSSRKEIVGKHITYSSSSTTIRITKDAWDQLRRIKFELSCESYSQGIVFLYALTKGYLKNVKLKGRKQPKQKFPKEGTTPLKDSSKTVVISKHAYDVFDKLREENQELTYSTAINYLFEIFLNWLKVEENAIKYFNSWISIYAPSEKVEEGVMKENPDLDLLTAIQRVKERLEE
ncbi:MAG: hypothetical protein ACFFCZ_01880 [Promethearchaeota archaeon]